MKTSNNIASKEFKQIVEQLKSGKETSEEYLVFKNQKANKTKFISSKQYKAVRNGK